MYRTHTCGELRLENCSQEVVLCGWLQRCRDKGSLIWLDLRDRYGITQIILDESLVSGEMMSIARSLGREYVIKVSGKVVERSAKNDKMNTGQIEIWPENIEILNPAKLPPFMIEDVTDGGDELRMKYRYLDLRRTPVRQNLELRHRMAQHIRRYLDQAGFLEVETPVLIKSTPEGARDFVVPSRMNAGQFYALPQSPQTFKQLLMVAGFDRYFQIVKCFRDEDLRADRQPEFTQIDCEMAFVEQQDVLEMFEGLVQFLFEQVKGFRLNHIKRMSYAEAMYSYGSDKPDLRFGMPFVHLTDIVKGFGFSVFDTAETVIGIRVEKSSNYSRKQLDELTEFVRRPQLGASGLFYLQCRPDGSLKSSVDKFYNQEQLKIWADKAAIEPDDLLLILAGPAAQTTKAMSELRLEMGNRLGLRDKNSFAALWVLDFPLLEYDEQTSRYHAMHHPFTSPKPEDTHLLDTNPGLARANAYDMVINGVEVGGGSVRIHHADLQAKMFGILGFEQSDAKAQFGFLMDAFEYGAPPHAGIAFGFDRLCALFGGADSIRDFIAFPKNNSGRDVMIDSPSALDQSQLNELHIKTL